MKLRIFHLSLLVLTFVFMTQANSALAQSNVSTVTNNYNNSSKVESKVREYFADTPAMIEIARCESNFRQFTDAGNPLRGGNGGGMIGVFQFFESIHAPVADGLRFDLETVEGNLAYASHIYKSQGTTPWNSSKNCWQSSSKTTTPSSLITKPNKKADLEKKIELLLQLIAILQKKLAIQQALAY